MQITLTIACTFDGGLLMTADEFRYKFLIGIPIQGFDGYRLNNQQIESYIRSNYALCEGLLDIKLSPMYLVEQQTYEPTQFSEWGFMRTNYNIQNVVKVVGKLGDSIVTRFADNVIFKSEQFDSDLVSNLNVIPTNSFIIIYTSSVYFLSLWRTYVPNYWEMHYITGYKQIPEDIFNYVGKRALRDILTVLANMLFPIGISSNSKSIDGISQSISTTRSGTTNIFTATKNELTEEFKQTEIILASKYKRLLLFKL